MLPCPSCDRHVRGNERACPFCKAVLRSTKGHRAGAAVIVIAVGSVLAACGPTVPDAGDMADDASSSSTGVPVDPTTGLPDPSTEGTTTIEGTSDPTMAMSTTTGLGETSTGGSTTWADDSNDTVCGFYGGCPVDGGGVDYECNVFMQDCGEGEKCAAWANDGGDTWNASRCAPVEQDADVVGDPCTVEGSGVSGIDTCALGSMCFYVDPDTNEGVCVELCSGTADDPVCLEGTCIVQFDGALPLCFVTCDPKDPACDVDETCEPALDETVDAQVCNPV